MSVGRRPAIILAPVILLAACAGGHPPLATIERIPGSGSRDGGTIVPVDSTRTIHRAAGTTSGTNGEIRPIRDSAGTTGTVLPRREGAPSTAGEIVPLHDTSAVVPLDGTRWQGTAIDGPVTLEFLVGGFLRYTTANGTFANGSWHQDGNAVTFEMNSHYADYTGHIHGTRMSGRGENRAGRTFDWEATRQ